MPLLLTVTNNMFKHSKRIIAGTIALLAFGLSAFIKVLKDNKKISGMVAVPLIALLGFIGITSTYVTVTKYIPLFAANSKSVDLEYDNENYLSKSDTGAGGSLDITGNLCFMGWLQPEHSPVSGETMRVFSKWSAAPQLSYTLNFLNSSGSQRLLWGISNNGTTASTKYVSWTPTPGTWYHIGMSYDASAGTVDFYENGAQLGTQQTGMLTSIYDSTSAFNIGNYDTGMKWCRLLRQVYKQ